MTASMSKWCCGGSRVRFTFDTVVRGGVETQSVHIYCVKVLITNVAGFRILPCGGAARILPLYSLQDKK